MADSVKEALDKLTNDPEFQKKLQEHLDNPQFRIKLANAMIGPIKDRLRGGPTAVCEKCRKPLWEAKDVVGHTEEDCLVYYVMES